MAELAPFTLDLPTVLSVGFALSLMPLAFGLGTLLIPSNQLRNRVLFIWHAYDALTHIFIEGAFLYECFFSYAIVPSGVLHEPFFLGYKDRVYGPAYGSGPTARLWQEYAKADRRWQSADPTVISLEILTVFLGGPAALYICYLVYQASSLHHNSNHQRTNSNSSNSNTATTTTTRIANTKSRLWFIAPLLAIAELYGGWMTFAPEWLTASSQLDAGHPVYLWLYLVFFNVLWVILPGWILVESSKELTKAFVAAEHSSHTKKKH